MKESIYSRRRIWTIAAGILVVAMVVGAALVWQPAKEKLAPLFRPPAETAATAPQAPAQKQLYYCPMHPSFRSDKPGDCQICGMKLVPVEAPETKPAAEVPPTAIQISPARQQLVGITTAPVEYRTLDKTIRTVGRVELDETRVANVHVKINGWIQKVFADYTFQYVEKGDPLFTIYSPELMASEQEFLLALKARRTLGESSIRDVALGADSLLEAARRRLTLWDLTDEQIRELEETGRPQREVTFFAPVSGHVIERKAFPNQYVTPETELYKLADHSVVWIYADIYEMEAPLVSVGQEATLTSGSLPGHPFKGRVSYIWPHLKEDTRTLPVRMEFPNPELKLKPGMFVNVELHRALGRQLTVPVDAVIDTGRRQVAFVDLGDGYFDARAVKLGERTETFVAVTSGLRAGEKVVTRANFLLDSESNLRQAIAGMAGHEGHAQPPTPPAEKPPAREEVAPPAAGGHRH